MYQALIIDDEKHVRQAITILGRWSDYQFNPPIHASNGKSALMLMEEQRIDLVLLDIKMPVMDGMQFLDLATKRFPEAKYIIISGFGDFEYAKKAIQFHIMDYLLKPISEDELNRCLEKTGKKLKEDQELVKINPLSDLINRISDQSSDYDLCGAVTVHIAARSCCDNPAWDETMIHILTTEISKHFHTGEVCLYRTEQTNSLLLGILIPKYAKRYSSLQELQDRMAHRITSGVNTLFKVSNTITVTGISRFTAPGVINLKQSFQTASTIAERLNLYCSVPIVSDETKLLQSYSPVSILAKKELLKRAWEKGDSSYFQSLIDTHYESLQKRELVTLETLHHNSMELLLLLHDYAQERGIEHYRDILPSLSELKLSGKPNSTKAFSNYFTSLFLSLYRNTSPEQPLTIQDILFEIKTYIDENYACDINLTYFSNKYHMTKEYLSKQFKEVYHHGIYEYVLSYRMQLAGRLLSASEKKIQEISNQVGYTDTSYFSKAFKTYHGISPKEYRRKEKGI